MQTRGVTVVVMGLILVLAAWFRIYNYEKGFLFNHDQDLYSWIAKDIIVNHHQRLVGQITSVDGVFIGSFYYYLMAAFYWMFEMNPLSAVIPITIIGVFNVWSFYYVIGKFYGKKAGITGALIAGGSWGMALFDRWSVPTQPTITWSIWFLYCILASLKREYKFIPLYGFLVGFVWQLHIALLPVLPLPILGYLWSQGTFKSKLEIFKTKWLWTGIGVFLIVSLPFGMFEIKHNFSQIKSMMAATKIDKGGPTGIAKMNKVLDASAVEIRVRLVNGWQFKEPEIIWLIIGGLTVWLVYKKYLGNKEAILIGIWVGLIFGAQFVSKRIVSEYYFTNLVALIILIIALSISKLKAHWLAAAALGYLSLNTFWLITRSENDESIFFRNKVVASIKKDMTDKGFDCAGFNYIADPGVGVGFRYLFWRSGIDTVKPNKATPIYNIVIPWGVSRDEIDQHFGRFGLILPKSDPEAYDFSVCHKPELIPDTMLGYTE